ncbi:two-component system response regulator NarL [Alkalimarinus sediminis]|uniref:Two-component system response regulator NarL n=1 Tax=Alkalimarinus sediminis TaxID=1632866 RepID=A0A9E8HQL8_9ALTE|nr:two-component system response regulator NarL [Alkalimarinus sediminis]UZW74726.1 two-component system response regulator NarL [Alkalimarinus sediminis]
MTAGKEQLNILIVDDHPMLRRGVKQLLELEAGLDAIGEASSGQEALEIAERLEPDLILLDLNMKGMDGIATLKAMRDKDIYSRIVIFTVSDDHDDVIAALKAGADGYVLKETEPEELVSYIRQAATGTMAISDKLAAVLASEIGNRKEGKERSVDGLTQRERQILKQIAAGMSNKMIASKLDIAEGTVKVHVKNLLKKLKMRSRVEAAIWAMENSLN